MYAPPATGVLEIDVDPPANAKSLHLEVNNQSLHTSSIMQFIFSFWYFEISEDFLRNQKIIISLDTDNQCLIYLDTTLLLLKDLSVNFYSFHFRIYQY